MNSYSRSRLPILSRCCDVRGLSERLCAVVHVRLFRSRHAGARARDRELHERAPFPPPARHAKLLKWKSIVNPAEVVADQWRAYFDLAAGFTGGFDECKEKVTRRRRSTRRPGNVLRVNHYFSRSREEFQERSIPCVSPRAHPHQAHADPSRRQPMADKIEAETVADDTIQQFVPALRKRLTQTRSPQPS